MKNLNVIDKVKNMFSKSDNNTMNTVVRGFAQMGALAEKMQGEVTTIDNAEKELSSLKKNWNSTIDNLKF